MVQNIFHVFDTSRLSGHQTLSMHQPFHSECDYSGCDRDLVLAVNQHQSFPDREPEVAQPHRIKYCMLLS